MFEATFKDVERGEDIGENKQCKSVQLGPKLNPQKKEEKKEKNRRNIPKYIVLLQEQTEFMFSYIWIWC